MHVLKMDADTLVAHRRLDIDYVRSCALGVGPVGYDPAFPQAHYDHVADKEWTRLTRNRRGELNFLVHMDVLRQHITRDMDVLEIGAGAGIYTKEPVHMTRRLVVSDLSEV